MKILFITPYPPDSAPSQRFRFEQYFSFLSQKGIVCRLRPFIDERTWNALYQPGKIVAKLSGIFKGFLRRIAILPSIWTYDFVFIHREAAPIGPPAFEWIIANVFRKKIIFDFDDAIWLPNTSPENKAAASLKYHSKTASIIRWSHKISAGNEYLASFARLYNAHVVVNPTTIDTENLHNRIKDQYTDDIVIGWTGTHSTVKYLQIALPALQRLEKMFHFRFLVISDKNPRLRLKSFQFKPWRKETEIEDLLAINIGLMPLTDDQWALGKCGFKALQYLALGIPTLASPVGVNSEIVDEGENGYLCKNDEEWFENLKLLIKRPELRQVMGANGRKKVEDKYSTQANKENFLSLFY